MKRIRINNRIAALAATAAVAGLAIPASASADVPHSLLTDSGAEVSGSWTGSSSCTALCAASAVRPTTGGTPGAYLSARYSSLLGLGSSALGTVSWTSGQFVFHGETPRSATLSFDRRVDAGGLLAVNSSLAWNAELYDRTTGVAHALTGGALTRATDGFESISVSVDPALLVEGHSYEVRSRTTFNAAVGLVTGAIVDVDNVKLTSYAADPAPTPGPAPSIGGSPQITVTTSGAQVTGSVNTNGESAKWWIEYGTDVGYGQSTPIQTIDASSAAVLEQGITGLQAGTTYHARIVVETVSGVRSYGSDQSFTTAADPGTTDPGTTDPGATDPDTTDPDTTDPGTADPGTTDPGTTDPGTTDPDTTDPGTTDPGTTSPTRPRPRGNTLARGRGRARPAPRKTAPAVVEGVIRATTNAGWCRLSDTVRMASVPTCLTLTASTRRRGRLTLRVRSAVAIRTETVTIPRALRMRKARRGALVGTLKAGRRSWRIVRTAKGIRVIGRGAPRAAMRRPGLILRRLPKGTRSVRLVLRAPRTARARRAATRIGGKAWTAAGKQITDTNTTSGKAAR